MINCRKFLQLTASLQAKDTVIREIFARRLNALAEAAGLSQAALARALKIRPAVVGNWFQARNLPETKVLPALAEVLKTNIDNLFGKDSVSRDPTVEEPQAGYGGISSPVKAERFHEYLGLLRSFREEAERLGAGDQQKTIELFDKMLDGSMKFHARPETIEERFKRLLPEVLEGQKRAEEQEAQVSKKSHGRTG